METADLHIPTILIVDDNPKNLQILGKLLKEEKYQVEFASDGVTALDWIKDTPFDLLLLDINMPGMSGYEVCKIVRSDSKMNKVPIIFLSAENDRESILKGFELGGQDYITKPFDSKELLVRVKTHITLKQSLEKLETINQQLEEKVIDRTHQLLESNEKLEVVNIKLKELDKAKADFLKMISHQIRTPLNGLVGPIELLKEHKESKEIFNMIKILDKSVIKLEKFSLNALLITEIRIEGDNLIKENISLSGIIGRCLEDYEVVDQILEKKLKMQISDMTSDIKIHGNLRLVQIAIINVMDNAIKFSTPESVIKFNIIKNDNSVVLEIIDQGEGFLEKSLVNMNDQLSSKELPIIPNLGLSLNLVKLIMDFHHGKVEVKNNKDVGACVSLYFDSL